MVPPAVVPYLNLMPLPNGQDLGDGTGRYFFTFSQPTNQNYGNIRIDHNLSQSDSLFGSYVIDDSSVTSNSGLPLFTDTTPFRSQYATLEETRIFTPVLLNLAHLGFNRSSTVDTPQCDASVSKVAFVPNGKCIRTSGNGLTLPSSTLGPRFFILNSFQYSEMLSWTRGINEFKFGASLERFRVNGGEFSSPEGLYQYNSLADFLRGNPLYFEAPLPGQDIWR